VPNFFYFLRNLYFNLLYNPSIVVITFLIPHFFSRLSVFVESRPSLLELQLIVRPNTDPISYTSYALETRKLSASSLPLTIGAQKMTSPSERSVKRPSKHMFCSSTSFGCLCLLGVLGSREGSIALSNQGENDLARVFFFSTPPPLHPNSTDPPRQGIIQHNSRQIC
jgi:hypothetical protein